MAVRRALIVGLVGVALIIAGTGPALAGDPTSFKIAKKIDGPYVAGIRRNLGVGEKKPVFLKVRGINGEEPVTLLEQDVPDDYNTRYFTKKGTNITSLVKSASYSFLAKPDKARFFRVTVKRTPGADAQGCWLIRLNENELIQFVAVGLNANPALCAVP